MTEQQEFLEILQDPTWATLLKASREFHHNYSDSINYIHVHPFKNDEYLICMHADEHRSLADLNLLFTTTLAKHTKGIMIKSIVPIEECSDGTFMKVYLASWRIS